MEFCKAEASDRDAVVALWKSVIGDRFCFWDDDYPGEREADSDISSGGLYILRDGKEIAATVAVLGHNEYESVPGVVARPGVREISRIAVSHPYRGHGYGGVIVSCVCKGLRESGAVTVRLSVAERNLPARRTYEKLGFLPVAEADMYGGHFFILEKSL